MKKVSKSEVIWHKIFVNNNFDDLVNFYRQELNISGNNFKIKNAEERLKIFKRVTSSKNNLKKINIFLSLLDGIVQNKYVLEKFKFSIINYLLFDDHNYFKNIDLSGCELFWIKDGLKNGANLDKGIYIKIGNGVGTFEDIKIFIEKNKTDIEFLQKKLFNGKNRIRESKNWLRDAYIYRLNKKTKKELCLEADKNINSQGMTKDILISVIFDKRGWSSISPENVRRIISRQKNLVEGDFVTFN